MYGFYIIVSIVVKPTTRKRSKISIENIMKPLKNKTLQPTHRPKNCSDRRVPCWVHVVSGKPQP